jgi:methyl-accepting chemotaxis protein
MSIGKKLYFGFGAILGIVLVLSALNLLGLRSQNQAREAVATAAEVRFQMMQNRTYLGNYLMSGLPQDLDALSKGEAKLTALLKQAQASAHSEQQRAAFAKVADAEYSWNTDFANGLVTKRMDVDSGNATVNQLVVAYMEKNPADWLKKSTDPLDAAVAISDKDAERAASLGFWGSLVGLLLAIPGCGAIAFYTAKSITQPLSHLMGIAREISNSGDLDQKVDTSRQDEIGELARSFDNLVNYLKEMAEVSEAIAKGDLSVEVKPRSERDTLANAFAAMTDGLRDLVKGVRDGASQVASGSGQVADASEESAKASVQASSAIDEVTSTMHEMTINVQNMVKNTQTQASSVSETSASIDQMVASIQRVADTAKVLLDISQRSREEVQSGLSTMEKATDGLERINLATQTSAEIIGSLDQRADDIGKIIEVIDDLAEQTNLLALNAAIEAARAGEHGLGFAVVADEVRKLAEKSAQSTKEISELIGSIQKEARKAVDNMQKSTGIINEGQMMGVELSTALRKISSVVTEVYKFAQEIGAATNEQSNGSTQIAKATTRLNEITHEINSSVEEQASGAQGVMKAMEKMRQLVQQTTSGSTELAASAEQMSKMSRKLLEAMDTFTLENGNGNGDGRGIPPAFRPQADHRRTTSAHRYAAAARS